MSHSIHKNWTRGENTLHLQQNQSNLNNNLSNQNENMENGEIILYQPNEVIKLEVRLEEESVWLTRHQLALLFDRDVKTIGKHINIRLTEPLK